MGRAFHGNEQTNLLNERLAQMDFEPYDEAKHGVPEGRVAKWNNFFAALLQSPQVINTTARASVSSSASYRGIKISINQLVND